FLIILREESFLDLPRAKKDRGRWDLVVVLADIVDQCALLAIEHPEQAAPEHRIVERAICQRPGIRAEKQQHQRQQHHFSQRPPPRGHRPNRQKILPTEAQYPLEWPGCPRKCSAHATMPRS